MRRAFTIIELLFVIGIITVLLSIVVVTANGVQKASREKRATAMASALEQGLCAYYAQMGEWPETIESKSKSMTEESYTFNPSETDEIFRELVGKGFGKGKGAKSMLVDATALYAIATSQIKNGGWGCNDKHGDRREAGYCGDQHCPAGFDFGSRHLSLSTISFGYPGREHGRFCRFKIVYNGKTDSVKVTK